MASSATALQAALVDLDEDELLRLIEDVVRTRHPTRGDEIGALLRFAMEREEVTMRLSGRALRVYSSASEAYADLQTTVMARRDILAQDMLDASAVAEVLGYKGANVRDLASDLRRRGQIVGVRDANRYLYLAFQFDPKRAVVRPIVSAINQHLDSREDPWAVASWWVSPNPRLSGRAPWQMLGTNDESDLLELAGVSAPVPVPSAQHV
jgi:hypothetical protein